MTKPTCSKCDKEAIRATLEMDYTTKGATFWCSEHWGVYETMAAINGVDVESKSVPVKDEEGEA